MRSISSAVVMVLLAAIMAILPGKAAHADLLLDITGDSVANCGACGDGDITIGWAFTVVNPVTIDGLGLFDIGAGNLGVASVPVGLWTGDGSSLLAQVTVTDASTQVASTDANGDWLFETIAPLTRCLPATIFWAPHSGRTHRWPRPATA
jgi:hypothetical protein